MKIELGDILICKKRVAFRDAILVEPLQKVRVSSLYGSYLITLVYNKSNDSFVMSSLGQINFYNYIWDYFYTEKEVRKMKLDKLKII